MMLEASTAFARYHSFLAYRERLPYSVRTPRYQIAFARLLGLQNSFITYKSTFEQRKGLLARIFYH